MINFDYINKSILFYEDSGFKRVESPWTVTQAVSDITKPPGAKDFTITEKNKVLVASGEQSFLYMYLKGFLPLGQFQTVTPCFRDESFDDLHTKYFIKNELIKTDVVNEKELEKVISTALNFFKTIYKGPIDIQQISNLSYDIICNDIEIGSYGIRSCSYLNWIYGTGLAEPRFSNMVKNLKNSAEK